MAFAYWSSFSRLHHIWDLNINNTTSAVFSHVKQTCHLFGFMHEPKQRHISHTRHAFEKKNQIKLTLVRIKNIEVCHINISYEWSHPRQQYVEHRQKSSTFFVFIDYNNKQEKSARLRVLVFLCVLFGVIVTLACTAYVRLCASNTIC